MPSTARAYGDEGYGRRTGAHVDESVRSVDDVYNAVRSQMQNRDEDVLEDEEIEYTDEGDSYEEDETLAEEERRRGQSSARKSGASLARSRKSSNMDIAETSGISPRTAIRQSRGGIQPVSEGEDEDFYNELPGVARRAAPRSSRGNFSLMDAEAEYQDKDDEQVNGNSDIEYGGDMPSFNLGVDAGDEDSDARLQVSPPRRRVGGSQGGRAVSYGEGAEDEEERYLSPIPQDDDEDAEDDAVATATSNKGKQSKTAKGKAPARAKSKTTKAPPVSRSGAPHRKTMKRISQAGNSTIQEVQHIPASYHLDAGTFVNEDGVRRSSRKGYEPVEWWRMEGARYGRFRDDDEDEDAGEFEARPRAAASVPVLKKIIRIPRKSGEGTFAGMRRHQTKKKGTASKRAKKEVSESVEPDEERFRLNSEGDVIHPEDGWDKDTDPIGRVYDTEIGHEMARRIACTSKQTKPRAAYNSSFMFEKVFGVDDAMAAGMLEIPPGGIKPTKPSKDNNYTFVVLQGAVHVRVHRTSFIMAPGGMFLVPKGNNYSIENVSKRRVKLFFSQARNAQDFRFPPPSSQGQLAHAAVASGSAERGVGNETFGNSFSQPPVQNGKRDRPEEEDEEEEAEEDAEEAEPPKKKARGRAAPAQSAKGKGKAAAGRK